MRYSAPVAAIVALFACVAAASASAAPLIWTVNTGTNSVSTIDSGTNQLVGPAIPVGESPLGIAITPDGQQALVATHGGEQVTAINTASRIPKAIPVGEFVERIAISPDGKSAYFTTESSEEVFVINTETDAVVGSFPVGPEAYVVAFSPDGTRAYVGMEKGVDVVNTATRKVIAGPIDVGGFPEEIAVSPDGKSMYVVAESVKGIAVIDTALNQFAGDITTATEPTSIAVSPDGRRLYATTESAGTVTVIETATKQVVGSPIAVGGTPDEIAITPSGRTAYVAGHSEVTPIALATNEPGAPIATPGAGIYQVVVAPDQSPTAVFTWSYPIALTPTPFDATASTDPDGYVTGWIWNFGDGGTGTGSTVTHTFGAVGTYTTQLSVVDNEGCGSAEVFTGRTAYCSGGPSTVQYPVTVAPASNKFRFGRLIHNHKNGTVKLQVKLPGAGSLLLFGKQVHAVTRKVKKAGSMWLTIHARVEVNKRLKKVHRIRTNVRVTFTPTAGTARAKPLSILLLRSPRKKHDHR
jgi:YVTN family beta-propeller protein